MTRDEAILANLKKYIPDTPCKHGHSLRYTSSNGCCICNQEYYKTYYQNHKEYYKKHYQDNIEEIAKYQLEYNSKHREEKKLYYRQYYKKNRDHILTYKKKQRENDQLSNLP